MASRQNSWTSNTSSVRRSSRAQRECKVSGCKKLHCYVKAGEKKIYSQYCIRHTCFRRFSIKDGFFCSIHVVNDEKYCLEHMTCAADQCRHTGSYEDVQTHEDDTHPWFCPSHRCGHDNCKSGIDDILSKRCREHQECAAPQCTSKPDHNAYSHYCPTHTCQGGAGTCSLQAISDNRCRDHLKCGLPSCPRPCHRTAAGRLEFLCHAHLATKCVRPGCGRIKLYAHRRYCLDHGCCVPDCTGERHLLRGT
ncbi:hypothetical protein B0T18DRAFT_422560 [Schizothecium vesticola]|uniref:Uncharacterized protein n=1 Tax=Schizothecium vesticola TaxID=314040 RepID=A0AA40BQR6_9PEZI|nr:hypothetical protein B0T18DRAFT_422560 [Schizothecium vesticola]